MTWGEHIAHLVGFYVAVLVTFLVFLFFKNLLHYDRQHAPFWQVILIMLITIGTFAATLFVAAGLIICTIVEDMSFKRGVKLFMKSVIQRNKAPK